MIENCPMRHENGNCIPAGGFCTANKNICVALFNAYRMGKAQLSKEGTTSDLISRQAVIDLLKQMRKDGDMVPWEGKNVFARIRKLPSAQPELIEKTAYIRGFEQGRTQGMIDSQGGRNE